MLLSCHVRVSEWIYTLWFSQCIVASVNIGEVEKEIHKLDKTKASQKTDTPTRIIKENIDIFANFLCMSISSAIKSASFSSSVKLADVTPLHKNGRKDMKENFRPLSILPTLSKNFE